MPPWGSGLLADELYLLAHDDVTGRPRLAGRSTGLGIAAGLLGELLLAGKVTVHSGQVVVLRTDPPADALAHRVLDHLVAERQRHPVRTWLAFLGRTATEQVAERLERANLLTRTASRRLFGGGGARFVPVDMTTAFAPLARLRTGLTRAEAMTMPDVLLAGLAVGCGLGPVLLQDVSPDGRDYLDYLLSIVDPPVRELVAHTRAAVDAALLTHRA